MHSLKFRWCREPEEDSWGQELEEGHKWVEILWNKPSILDASQEQHLPAAWRTRGWWHQTWPQHKVFVTAQLMKSSPFEIPPCGKQTVCNDLARCHVEYQLPALLYQRNSLHLRYIEANLTGEAREHFLYHVGRFIESEPMDGRIRATSPVVRELGIRYNRVSHKHPLTNGDTSVCLLNADNQTYSAHPPRYHLHLLTEPAIKYNAWW